jgi:predicted HTH transcriptional regulator
MIDLSELLENLKSQPSESFESETIEFKNYRDSHALYNSKDLCDEICAFANKNGGRIIIGIKDSSEIRNQDFQQQLVGFEKIDLDVAIERINGKLKPKLDLSLEYAYYEGKGYLVISVPNIRHSLVSTSSGKVYIREGKSSVPAEPYQIQDLVANLQTYDWSSQEIETEFPLEFLNNETVKEAKQDFAKRRGINVDDLSDLAFLESINATKNGVLNFSGLLFLGKTEQIEKYLGNFEYRFSWRTSGGTLKVNDVWNDCIWNSIKRAKSHFLTCNEVIDLPYNEQTYTLTSLDDQAFHEAFLNSIVHRDYSIDGMVTINYKENELVITNPGSFYGGVNEENISYHEPRHRNKSLAKLLMAFQLVDRAGMGVLRISLNSLKYGRDFPSWKENLSNIEVRMPAEYFKATIFVLTQKYLTECSITDMLILNKLYEIGYVSVNELERELKRIYKEPWMEIEKSIKKEKMKEYIELRGNNNGIFITTTELSAPILEVDKKFRDASNSSKHVKLFLHLKKHKNASNGEIKDLLQFSRSSVTSDFLAKLKYIKNTGKSRSSRWNLKN